jgi:hypothetical protein
MLRLPTSILDRACFPHQVYARLHACSTFDVYKTTAYNPHFTLTELVGPHLTQHGLHTTPCMHTLAGKTHVIKAVLRFAGMIGCADRVAVTAITGSAAGNLGVGTYHGALNIPVFISDIDSADQNARKRTPKIIAISPAVRRLWLIITDEVSMLKPKDLGHAATNAQLLRGDNPLGMRTEPWAGLSTVYVYPRAAFTHIFLRASTCPHAQQCMHSSQHYRLYLLVDILTQSKHISTPRRRFVGDLSQLEPVASIPVYANPDTVKDNMTRLGIHIWQNLNAGASCAFPTSLSAR